MRVRTLIPALLTLSLGGCAGADPLALAPTPPEAPLTATVASEHGSPGAWVIKKDGNCFFPAYREDGSRFPIQVPCTWNVVVTGNQIGVFTMEAKAVVPNGTGVAQHVGYAQSGVPCSFGITDVFLITPDYQIHVSATGQLTLNCRFREER